MDKVFITVGIFVVAALLFVAPIMAGVSIVLNLDFLLQALFCMVTVMEYLLLCIDAMTQYK